jgi:hypothetical protein
VQIQRRQRQRAIEDHLDRGAAMPEQHQGAELLVGGDPDDQLVSARPADHRLHAEALRARLGRHPRDPLEHRRRRLLDVGGAEQIEGDATDAPAATP